MCLHVTRWNTSGKNLHLHLKEGTREEKDWRQQLPTVRFLLRLQQQSAPLSGIRIDFCLSVSKWNQQAFIDCDLCQSDLFFRLHAHLLNRCNRNTWVVNGSEYGGWFSNRWTIEQSIYTSQPRHLYTAVGWMCWGTMVVSTHKNPHHASPCLLYYRGCKLLRKWPVCISNTIETLSPLLCWEVFAQQTNSLIGK